MEFFKVIWRGMRDVYDSFMYFILVSLAFWLLCVPMILGYGFLAIGPVGIPIFVLSAALFPPALVALFALTDPRTVVSRIEWSDAFELVRSSFPRAWKVAFVTILPLLMIGWNIVFFTGSGHTVEMFVPLWIVMWVFLFILTFFSFSLAGTHESGWRNAYRGSMFTLVKYPFRTIGLSLFIITFGYLSTLALLPMLVIGPAFFAAIVTRFVFEALEVHVPDPNAPTDERAYERERGINPDRSLIDRVLRREKR